MHEPPPKFNLHTELYDGTSDDRPSHTDSMKIIGDGAHVPLTRKVLRRALELAPPLGTETIRIGTADSGIDFTAMAAHGEIPRWKLVFASERDQDKLQIHKRIWNQHDPTYYTDSTAPEATAAPHVHVWMWTPECKAISRLNRRWRAHVARAIRHMYKTFEYARRARPNIIIMENVASWEHADRSAARRALHTILGSAPGYTWYAQTISPHTHARAPIRRPRRYWVGIRKS